MRVINACAQHGRRYLKLTVSHEEINGINWFLVALIIGLPPYGGFYRITVKIQFCPNLGKKGKNDPKIVFFEYFEELCHVRFS